MKTSEFREYLEENWKFEETEDYFKVRNLVIINKKNNRVEFLTCVYLDVTNTINFVNKIIEYASTPLEEREEEKKYRLRLPRAFCETYEYVNFRKINKDYLFVGMYGNSNYQTEFTQKEIDAMPFDTNFFIKEEVK